VGRGGIGKRVWWKSERVKKKELSGSFLSRGDRENILFAEAGRGRKRLDWSTNLGEGIEKYS